MLHEICEHNTGFELLLLVTLLFPVRICSLYMNHSLHKNIGINNFFIYMFCTSCLCIVHYV